MEAGHNKAVGRMAGVAAAGIFARREGDARDFVFAGSVGKISGFSKLKIALDKVSGVSDWRLHDLRRRAASRMQDLGIRTISCK